MWRAKGAFSTVLQSRGFEIVVFEAREGAGYNFSKVGAVSNTVSAYCFSPRVDSERAFIVHFQQKEIGIECVTAECYAAHLRDTRHVPPGPASGWCPVLLNPMATN